MDVTIEKLAHALEQQNEINIKMQQAVERLTDRIDLILYNKTHE